MNKKNKIDADSRVFLDVFVEKDNKLNKVEIVSGKTTVKEILKKLNILSSTSIITINDDVATDDDILNESDKVKILSVISGG
jgi:sulfur carrier protein ThiS